MVMARSGLPCHRPMQSGRGFGGQSGRQVAFRQAKAVFGLHQHNAVALDDGPDALFAMVAL